MSEKEIAILIVVLMFVFLFANMFNDRDYEVNDEDMDETNGDC